MLFDVSLLILSAKLNIKHKAHKKTDVLLYTVLTLLFNKAAENQQVANLRTLLIHLLPHDKLNALLMFA